MNRKSVSLMVLIICAVLVLLPSCKKKGETETAETPAETTAVAETGVSTEVQDSAAAAETKGVNDEIFSPSPVVIAPGNTKTESAAENEAEAEDTAPADENVYVTGDSLVITEDESGNDTFFDGYFTYRGIESRINVGRTSTTLTLPEGVTYEDILSIASMINERYPLESSLVVYDVTEGKVVLTYPGQTEEYLITALDYLDTAAMEYIDSIYSRSETEEEAAEKAHESTEKSTVYAGTLGYKGYVSTIEVYTTYATLTVPEGMESGDVEYVASLINMKYPDEASLVTYTLDNGILELYYPEQSREFLLYALDTLCDEAVCLIDSMVKEEVPVHLEEKAEPSVEAVEEKKESAPVTETPVTVEEKGDDSSKTAESAAVQPAVPKAGKTEKVVRGFSIAAYVLPEYTPSFSDKGWTPLNFSAGVKFEAGLTKSLAFGLEVQYDFSRFMEAGTYLRWTFADMEKVKLYSTLGFGGVFGLPGNSGNNSLLISGGVGCEYFFTPSFSLFGEAVLEWSKSLGFEAGMAIGLRYSF